MPSVFQTTQSRPLVAAAGLGLALGLGAAALAPAPALAHFQLAYTPEVNLARPGDVPVKLIFWHPFEAGHAMDMAPPRAVYAVHKGERIDLAPSLAPITFQAPDNAAAAYDVTLPVKRAGDYVIVVEPEPYLEASEDIYIQQITKSIVNRATLPTDWMEPLGLKAEILPLNRPTNIIAGSTFTGQVLAEGQPVAGAEVEIEYLAAPPDMETNSASAASVEAMPGGAVVAITDANGVFTFGIPRAGFWGFAALGVGPDTEHEGKELSQDAVLWIHATEMK